MLRPTSLSCLLSVSQFMLVLLSRRLKIFILFISLQVLGPRFMENRKPYELKNLLIVYNLLQVLFSTWLFYEVRLLFIFILSKLKISTIVFCSVLCCAYVLHNVNWNGVEYSSHYVQVNKLLNPIVH